MTEPDEDEERHPGRDDPRSTTERLTLLERDARQLARMVTGIVDSGKSFSGAQMEQLRVVLREEFGNIGLRIDEDEHVDMAREDMRFLRRTRLKWDSASTRVGNIVIAAVVGLVLLIGGMGFWAWLNKGLGH